MPRDEPRLIRDFTTYVDYSDEEREYLVAVDRYCSARGRRFLLATEYLAIIKALGYRRVRSKNGKQAAHIVRD